jgi:cytochrome c-type biogenesis protein CcmE
VTTRARRRTIAAATVVVVAAIAIAVLAFQLSGNITYFRTVSEAVQQRSNDRGNSIRLAGEVEPGSLRETRSGVMFRVTDGKKTVSVVHQGDPPNLFDDGVPVVCEGEWGAGTTFESERILIKHGSEYEPPKVDAKQAK